MSAPLVGVARRVTPAGGAAALARLLDTLARTIGEVPPAIYRAQLLPGVSGSVGEHVRHILDHVTAFVTTPPGAGLTYDRRERGTSVETDRTAALQSLRRLQEIVEEVDDNLLDAAVTLSAVVSRGDAPLMVRSTRRRELAFVISHTVHHQALIAVLLAVAGVRVPETFGVAPTTPLPRG